MRTIRTINFLFWPIQTFLKKNLSLCWKIFQSVLSHSIMGIKSIASQLIWQCPLPSWTKNFHEISKKDLWHQITLAFKGLEVHLKICLWGYCCHFRLSRLEKSKLYSWPTNQFLPLRSPIYWAFCIEFFESSPVFRSTKPVQIYLIHPFTPWRVIFKIWRRIYVVYIQEQLTVRSVLLLYM